MVLICFSILMVLLGIIVCILVLIINRCLKKIDFYENWIVDVRNDVNETLSKMRTIDKQGTFSTSLNDKGNFECDDQVGRVFKDLLLLVEELDERIK